MLLQGFYLEKKSSHVFLDDSLHDFVKKWNRTKFYVKSVYDYAKICSCLEKNTFFHTRIINLDIRLNQLKNKTIFFCFI